MKFHVLQLHNLLTSSMELLVFVCWRAFASTQAGKLARSIWAEACATDEKDAILGVQQARNAMTACTYLATISVAMATAGG